MPQPHGLEIGTRIRRRTARASLRCIRARLHARGDARRSGFRHPSLGALYRSTVPDSAMGTPAKCLWTRAGRRISSSSSVRRTGEEMARNGTATCGQRTESARTARARRSPGELCRCRVVCVRGPEASWPAEVVVDRMGAPVTADSRRRSVAGSRNSELRHRDVRKGRGVQNRRVRTIACAGVQGVWVRLPRHPLTRDNCCYRASIR